MHLRLYGPVRNAFDAGIIHYEGKREGVGPRKSKLFWALLIGIELIGIRDTGLKKIQIREPG
jgi:hypothetical protein